MKIQIRNNVFETNSSSIHSLVFSDNGIQQLNLKPLRGYFDEYGWGYEVLTTSNSKLSYILTEISYLHKDLRLDDNQNIEKFKSIEKFRDLDDKIFEMTGYRINIDENSLNSGYYPLGYIDHQSLGMLYDKSVEELCYIIFSNSYIIIDNDNHYR